MNKKTEILGIDNGQLKYKAIITEIQHSIRDGELAVGDALPSITAVSKQFSCARETAVKAYNILKKQGVITSHPGKGFFLASDTMLFLPKVLLLLNNLTPYMEVLYNSFMKSLEGKAVVEVFFHHQNIAMFKEIISTSYGKYHSYIVKPFEHDDVEEVLEVFNDEELLLLDRRDGITDTRSYISQDFIEDFYNCLNDNYERFCKYKATYMIFTKCLSHPVDCISAFEKFIGEHELNGKCVWGLDLKKINRGDCYIALGDNELVSLLKYCRDNKYVIGKDIGIVSYNDTPMKEFVGDGITVFTADFVEMGREAAKFALEGKPVRKDVFAQTVLRSSL